MKNKAAFIIAFLLLIVGGLVGYIAAKKTPENNAAKIQSNENKDTVSEASNDAKSQHEGAMIDMAIGKIKKAGLYASSESLNCLSFGIEDEDDSFVDIVIREVHDEARGCGGDPGVAPLRDSFKVAKKTNQVYSTLLEPQLVDKCFVIEHRLDWQSATKIDQKSNYVVAKQGKANFYSAPDNSCQTQKFIIEGDKFVATYEYHGFIKGNYVNPKTKKETEGWILSDALMVQ